jgi:hypothetical protein
MKRLSLKRLKSLSAMKHREEENKKPGSLAKTEIIQPKPQPVSPQRKDFGKTNFLAFESGISAHSEVIELQVGDGPKTKTFYSNVKVLSQHSLHMQNFFDQNRTTNVLVFPEWDPLIFELFEKFTLDSEPPLPYQPCHYFLEDPWDKASLSACFLAIELSAPQFLRYSLSIFIQNCALDVFGPWARIERCAPLGSPLRRFSNHWVAWNVYLAGDSVHEYTGLKAEWLATSVTDDTIDPRILQLEHWFCKCGDSLSPGCDHDPIEQERKYLLEQQELERLDKERNFDDYDEEAIIYEIQANSRQAGINTT